MPVVSRLLKLLLNCIRDYLCFMCSRTVRHWRYTCCIWCRRLGQLGLCARVMLADLGIARMLRDNLPRHAVGFLL
jgi:hypothetical protein